MNFLLGLIPTKDWFIGAAVIGLAVLCWHFYDKYENAVNYANTIKAESAQAKADAAQQIADLTTQYSKALDANKVIYETELANDAAQHASDTERLRQLAAARNKDAVLSGASGLPAAIAAWSSRLSRLEQVSAGLADALRADDAAATACWRDRDALTGK
jgi:hypothetical protein